MNDPDRIILENALLLSSWNTEKVGLRLMQIDSDLIRHQAEENALAVALEKYED